MTKLRACLLLLVMLMLPIRGAMAGMGLLCQHAPQAAHAATDHVIHDHGAHGQHADHDARLVGQSAQVDHDGPAGADTCNLCTSVCSTPPLAGVAAQVPVPLDGGPLRFFPVDVARFGYVTDGLERPPRSI